MDETLDYLFDIKLLLFVSNAEYLGARYPSSPSVVLDLYVSSCTLGLYLMDLHRYSTCATETYLIM